MAKRGIGHAPECRRLFPMMTVRENLAMGCALAMCPRLLMPVMDEPSLGLAPNLAQSIFQTIREVNGQGVTVLLAERNVKQALGLTHRAYVLENGRLILQGEATEPAQNPHVRKAYLGI